MSSPEPRREARDDRDWHPIQSDHRVLGTLAERLDRLLGDLAAQEHPDAQAVTPLLEEFCARLEGHLAAEEESGVLESAAGAEPHLAPRVEALLLEHEELRRGAAGLADGPAEGPAVGPDGGEAPDGGPGCDWQAFHVRFATFRRVLHQHEQAENDVIHTAYMQDTGGG